MRLIVKLVLQVAALLGVIIVAGHTRTWFWETVLWLLAALLAGSLSWAIGQAARE